MTTLRKYATIPDARLSKQIATKDNAAANEEEVEEQIEEDNVEKAAGENGTGIPDSSMTSNVRSNEEIETAD